MAPPAKQSAVATARNTGVGLGPIFKEYVHLPFIEALPEDLFLLNRLETDEAQGEDYKFKIHYDGNDSVGSYSEQDDLGTVGHQKYLDGKVGYRLYKGEIEVTNFMIAATKGQGSYLKQFATESKGVLKDLRRKMNKDLLARDRAANTDFDSLGYIIDDGQVNSATGYAGILFAEYPWWKPVVYANGGTPRNLSIALMQTMTETLESDERNASISAVITARKHFNDYGNMFESQRRQVNTMTIKGGFTACEFEDKTLISVPSLPQGDIYFLDESELLYSILQDFDSKDKDVMRDAQHMVVTHYANLVCRDLRKQGRVADLA